MTLTTHAVVGSSVAQFAIGNPIAGFFLGFASHFLIDAIPHGHYKLRSKIQNPANRMEDDMALDRRFLYDIARIGFDCIMGFAVAAAFFHSSGSVLLVAFWGAIGGVLPDALQFAYWKIRREPLTSLQKFHRWIHAEQVLHNQPVRSVMVETATAAVAVLLALAIRA